MSTEARREPGVIVRLIQQPTASTARSYYAELSSDLLDPEGQVLDSMIGLVFDTLHAQCLNLRVLAADRSQPTACSSCFRPSG